MFDTRDDPVPAWAEMLGADLRQPVFHITLAAAFARRLRRNYSWMFLILLLAWLLKISSARLQESGRGELVQSVAEIVENARLGPFPGWLILCVAGALYGWLLAIVLRSGEQATDDGSVHV